MKLADIAGKIASEAVEIRGSKHSIRALTAAESELIRQAYPRPNAPVQPPHHKGSKAEPEPDEFDPHHRQRLQAWVVKCTQLEIAAGLDWETAGGKRFGKTEAEVKAWGEEALPEIVGNLTDTEFGLLVEAQRRAAGGSVIKALGN